MSDYAAPTDRQAKGIPCPKCGACRWKVAFTRYRPGATIRVRVCLECRHRVRTAERIESVSA